MSSAPGDQQGSVAAAAGGTSQPVLIYDGDCGFCGYWARYWQKLTGERVAYRPYQEVAAQYPQIPLADFQRAVQFIDSDGRRPRAERAYAFTAAHRPAFFRISRFLWGSNFEPPRYQLVSFLFLRGFGLLYL